MIYLKIDFDGKHTKLCVDTIYTFDGSNGELVDMKLVTYSRVDGLPIFALDDNKYTQLMLRELSLMSVVPSDLTLVKALEDHGLCDSYKENKDKISEFLFKLHRINDLDLLQKDAYKSIIRDIKLDILYFD